MKSFNILLVFLLVVFSCKNEKFTPFGEQIAANGAINHEKMAVAYQDLKVSDTLQTKFSGKVLDVCQSKGCWMKLELSDGKEAMVKFKDYGFFMPKDIKGREVIVNGQAFVESMSVDDQRHFAEDGGKSKEEIAAIVSPKKTFGFIADGVLLKE